MKFDDETLMAYVDGELDARARAALEAAAACDPALAQRIALQQRLRARLRREFDPVLAEPVPERLLAAAQGAATPEASAKLFELRRPQARWSWPQLAALAASLLLGALLGPWLLRSPASFVTRDGALVAGDTLAHALSQQLASSQPADLRRRRSASASARTAGITAAPSCSGASSPGSPAWSAATGSWKHSPRPSPGPVVAAIAPRGPRYRPPSQRVSMR